MSLMTARTLGNASVVTNTSSKPSSVAIRSKVEVFKSDPSSMWDIDDADIPTETATSSCDRDALSLAAFSDEPMPADERRRFLEYGTYDAYNEHARILL